jgi:uncharacterized peroxidase-related enzyme
MAFIESKTEPGQPNYEGLFTHRPEVYEAWKTLNVAVRGNMDLRRYELATLAAARRLRSSYCMLAHGSVLLDRFLDEAELRAVAADHRRAGLEEVDVAVMDFADQVVADASAVTAGDVNRLRDAGLSDAEIFDVAAAAAMRCFFSKLLDALGAEPDASYGELDGGLRDVLVVGRPIAGPAA